MKIITIIPAYNEEKSIKNVVRDVSDYTNVLVVDDGSSDLTSMRATEAGATVIKHQKNQGKGAAIKTGLKYALKENYDLMVLMDGDGQHDPRCIPILLSGMRNNDVIIGSRFQDGHPPNMPLQRRLSNSLTTALIKFITGYQISDSQCGFRVISQKAALLFQDVDYDDYVYESEVLYQAAKNNLTLGEEAIQCTYGNEKSYVRTKHVFHYILFIFRLISRKLTRRIKI